MAVSDFPHFIIWDREGLITIICRGIVLVGDGRDDTNRLTEIVVAYVLSHFKLL